MSKFTIPKEFTINRKIWIRGEHKICSSMLNNNGNHCCLGFFAMSCGASKEEINRICYLKTELVENGLMDFVIPNLPFSDEELVNIANTNDDSIPDSEIEQYITETFAIKDIKVNFIN